MYRYDRVPIVEEFQFLQDRFGFLPKHDVLIPTKGASMYDLRQEKVGVRIPLFDAGLCLPTSDFFNMIVDHYGHSIDELTSSVVNEIVCFELIFQSLDYVPSF